MKNFNTNRLLKPSVGRHIALLSRAQNSCLWRHVVNVNSPLCLALEFWSYQVETSCLKLYMLKITFTKCLQFVKNNGMWHFDVVTSSMDTDQGIGIKNTFLKSPTDVLAYQKLFLTFGCHLTNKEAHSCILDCDKTRRAFQNTMEM